MAFTVHTSENSSSHSTPKVSRDSYLSCACRFDEMNNEDEKIIARRVAEKSFHVNMPRVLRLLIAFGEVLLSHSAILCYFAMVLNTLMSGSILSLLFPISIFFWAMLSVPRPKKSYWVTIITYTEVCLVCGSLNFFCLCVCVCARLCVCTVHCGKTAERIWMPLRMVGRMGPE